MNDLFEESYKPRHLMPFCQRLSIWWYKWALTVLSAMLALVLGVLGYAVNR